MTITEEDFMVGDTVEWKGDESLPEEDDRENIKLLKKLFGPGPFSVRRTAPIENDEAIHTRHHQFLELSDATGETVNRLDLGIGGKLSGFWFVKVSSAKPN